MHKMAHMHGMTHLCILLHSSASKDSGLQLYSFLTSFCSSSSTFATLTLALLAQEDPTSTMSSSYSFSLPSAVSSTHSAEQARIRGTVVFTWSLMLIIVSLRFLARRLSRVGLWYDDWLIIPATVCLFQIHYLLLPVNDQGTRTDPVYLSAVRHGMLCLCHLE